MRFIYAHTTGIENPYLVHLSITSYSGATLYDSPIKLPYGVSIEDGAEIAHGISETDLDKSSAYLIWDWLEIRQILKNQYIWFHTDLTLRALKNTARCEGVDFDDLFDDIEFMSDYTLNESWSVSEAYLDIPEENQLLDVNDVSATNRAKMLKALHENLHFFQHQKTKQREQEALEFEILEKKRTRQRQAAEKVKAKKLALLPSNLNDYPYFGRDERPDGYKTTSQLKVSDLGRFEFAGHCIDSYGNNGYLFKPKITTTK
jgi:hypothetical protein